MVILQIIQRVDESLGEMIWWPDLWLGVHHGHSLYHAVCSNSSSMQPWNKSVSTFYHAESHHLFATSL